MPIGIDMNNYDISMGTGQIRMSGGGTFTSDNSINYDWIARASPADYIWRSIAYGNGLFVVVSGADGSNNSVMTSPDGINWTLRRTPNPGASWRSVAFGTPSSNPNGLFVAVADNGTGNRVMTSSDGITWTSVAASNNTNVWVSIAYGSGYFVATAHSGDTNRIMYSSNGTTWTAVATGATFEGLSVGFGNGRFVVGSRGSSNYVLYTNTNLSLNPPSTANWAQSNSVNTIRWNSITYGNGLFVAVSDAYNISGVPASGTGGQQLTSRVMTSPDGITWSNRYAPDIGWFGITYGAGMFVACSKSTTGNRTMTSPDGINWVLRPSANDTLNWSGITYGNGIFVTVAESGGSGNRVMTLDPAYGMSINKITTEETTTNLVKFGQNGATISANPSKNFAWVARTSAAVSTLYSVCYGNGQFVTVGNNAVMTSTDGYTWISRTPSGLNQWVAVCYGELSGNNLYVAVANSGSNRVMYSTNGTSWTSATSPVTMNWVGVCFGYDTSGNGRFVAVANGGTAGNNGHVMISSNGINWEQITTPNVTNGWSRVWYGYDSSGQGQFVAMSSNASGNRSMYSIDGGRTWFGKATTDNNSNWNGICYGNGTFVATADTGAIGRRVMYTRNIIGEGWSIANYPVENAWNNVGFGNGLFVAVGNTSIGNGVMTSPDGINWTIRASAANNNWYSVCYGNGTFVAISSNVDISNNVMTNDYTANDNMLALNGGISPSSGQLNVKSRLFVGPDGIYSYGIREWATTIMANTEGKVVLSTAPNGGIGGPNGFQDNAPFTIFDKFYSTWGAGLNLGLYRDTGSAYIQCQAANTGARNICLQPYNGYVGIATTAPAFALDVTGACRATAGFIGVIHSTVNYNKNSVGGAARDITGLSRGVYIFSCGANYDDQNLMTTFILSIAGTQTGRITNLFIPGFGTVVTGISGGFTISAESIPSNYNTFVIQYVKFPF
jgi:hypothetical protein